MYCLRINPVSPEKESLIQTTATFGQIRTLGFRSRTFQHKFRINVRAGIYSVAGRPRTTHTQANKDYQKVELILKKFDILVAFSTNNSVGKHINTN